MKRWTAVWLALAMTVSAGAAAARADEVELRAKKVSDAPAIDGRVDKAWDAVKATRITASEGPQGNVAITTKALYTDKEIFFLFQWPDKTMSMNRFFEFDGKEWKKVKGYEDRFNLAWDIRNTIKEFPAKGCTGLCHKEGKQVSFKTNGPSERVDIWHWKAQRSNPVGYMDDQWLGSDAIKSMYEGREVVRYRGNDKATSGAGKNNWDKEAKRPKYGWKNGSKPGPVLLEKDAVEIKDYGRFKAGDRLPLETLARPGGSRGEIDAKGVWANGRWTLEVKRARVTEDKENDVQFTDEARPYLFGISVHEDATEDEHSTTERNVLKLLLK
jgi:hypothetical protein